MNQPMGREAKTNGVKLDVGKPRMDLIPMLAQLEFAKVLTFGVKKYGANNWRKVVGWRWRYVAAGLRHITYYALGERSDPETGLHHLAHALCCFSFVLDNELSIERGATTVPDGDAVEPQA